MGHFGPPTFKPEALPLQNWGLLRIHQPKTSQMCPIGGISGDLADHRSAFTPCCLRKLMTTQASTVQHHDRRGVEVSLSGRVLCMTNNEPTRELHWTIFTLDKFKGQWLFHLSRLLFCLI